MHLVITLAAVANILSIIMLLIGLLYNFKQPKSKAVFGYFIAGSMILYLIVLSFITIYILLTNHYIRGIILLLCIISPFVIGKLVKFETLKKYTIIQIMCFIVSLLTLLL